MQFPSRRRRAVSFLAPVLLLAFSREALAATAADPAPVAAPAENPEAFSRVPGLFDVDLPKTVEKHTLKVLVHPHFGDLLNRPYLRVPLAVRLGLNDHTELDAELESYFTHGLKKARAGQGLDTFHLGAKYQWRRWFKEYADTSTGFNTSLPLGRPPIELTDGHYHFAPYVVFSKRWPQFPRLAPYLSLGSDLIWKSSVPGSFARNQPHSNSMGFTSGFLYDRDTFKYTLAVSYTTTALIGRESKHFVGVNPSVLWQLPRSLTFHSKSVWIVGLGVGAKFGPDGTQLSTSGKLRGEFRLSNLFTRSPK